MTIERRAMHTPLPRSATPTGVGDKPSTQPRDRRCHVAPLLVSLFVCASATPVYATEGAESRGDATAFEGASEPRTPLAESPALETASSSAPKRTDTPARRTDAAAGSAASVRSDHVARSAASSQGSTLVAVSSPLLPPAARPTAAIEEALEISERALDSAAETAGVDHPGTALLAVHTGSLYLELGDLSRARELLARALATYERVYGPDAAELTNVLRPLAVASFAMGDLDTTRSVLGRQLDIVTRQLGADTDTAADAMRSYAWVESTVGRTATARRMLRAAMRIYERAGQADSEAAGSAWLALGVNELRDTRSDDARVERALRCLLSGADLLEQQLPAGHPRLIALYRAMLDTPDLAPVAATLRRRLKRHQKVVSGPR